jgi:hypothetical protein
VSEVAQGRLLMVLTSLLVCRGIVGPVLLVCVTGISSLIGSNLRRCSWCNVLSWPAPGLEWKQLRDWSGSLKL